MSSQSGGQRPRRRSPHGRGFKDGPDLAGAARRAAHKVLVRVQRDGAYADRALHGVSQHLKPRERGQAKRLAFGAIQRQLTLNYLIDQHTDRQLDHEIRAALQIGAYELLYADGTPTRAAVASAVELAKPNHGYRLVNAVLRKIAGGENKLPDDSTPQGASVLHSHPLWLVEKWWNELGPEETIALLAANNEPGQLILRANTLRPDGTVPGDPYDLELPEARLVDGPLDVLSDPNWKNGDYIAMSRASMQVAPVLAPQPGERILDLCAAPGGKTTHIAALMGNTGEIVAVERHKTRAAALEKTCDRVGASIVKVVLADALELDLKPGSFDRVLLDGPCSGLGTLASRPDIRWKVQPEQIPQLIRLQGRLLDVAQKAVKPGGRLVYSTCTINPDEERLTDGEVRRFTPHHDKTDGFYIAASG